MTCSQAVILAAGIGSRLKPITLRKPKCSVTVDGTPILVHQVRAYAEAGVEDVYVVTGYMRGQVARLCSRVEAEYDDLTVTTIENEVYANTDNLYSFSLVEDAVGDETFLLSNGDVVYDPELVARVATHDGTGIATDRGVYDEEPMKVTVDADGYVDHISKDVPESEAYGCGTDLYRVDPEFSTALFDEVGRILDDDQEYTKWTELAIDRVLATGSFAVDAVDVTGLRWVEIDDYDDLTAADRTFASLRDLDGIEAAFLDLDGTVYLDDEPLEGATETVTALREHGIDVYFLSNNSSRWKTDYAARLDRLGIPADPDDVLLSTDGVIEYLRTVDPRGVYVVGTEAMRTAMADHGVPVVGESGDPSHVVVGFDTELTYDKVREATLAIRDGAEFLLAHPDTVCPTGDGLVPDCGSIGALVETATDRRPARVFGKPNPEMIRHVLDANGYDPGNVVVVGDRLETEMRMAHRLGCASVCVLTGDADRVDVEESDLTPSLVAPGIGALVDLLDPDADRRPAPNA
jgi:HAD superfamily hydrolase (TIGR01450 family)